MTQTTVQSDALRATRMSSMSRYREIRRGRKSADGDDSGEPRPLPLSPLALKMLFPTIQPPGHAYAQAELLQRDTRSHPASLPPAGQIVIGDLKDLGLQLGRRGRGREVLQALTVRQGSLELAQRDAGHAQRKR